MKLEEYLQEKLNITKEEAIRIVEVFHSYKKEYGHSHFHHQKGNTFENKNESNKELDSMYCDGCPSNCSLSNPSCGRGKRKREEFLNTKNES